MPISGVTNFSADSARCAVMSLRTLLRSVMMPAHTAACAGSVLSSAFGTALTDIAGSFKRPTLLRRGPTWKPIVSSLNALAPPQRSAITGTAPGPVWMARFTSLRASPHIGIRSVTAATPASRSMLSRCPISALDNNSATPAPDSE